jgi:preprotein translocase subunit YajC
MKNSMIDSIPFRLLVLLLLAIVFFYFKRYNLKKIEQEKKQDETN